MASKNPGDAARRASSSTTSTRRPARTARGDAAAPQIAVGAALSLGFARSASRAASRRRSTSTSPTSTTTARSASASWPPTSSPTAATRWRSSTSAAASSSSSAPTSRSTCSSRDQRVRVRAAQAVRVRHPVRPARASWRTSSGGTLTLHVGPERGRRLNGNISDIGETIIVKTVGERHRRLVRPVRRPRGRGELLPFTGVTKIVADGGGGNDVIDLSGVTDADDRVEIHGGDGNDTITGGAGHRRAALGDGGDDTSNGGRRRRRRPPRRPPACDDLETAGPTERRRSSAKTGNDTLDGDGGDDQLQGGAGDDTYSAAPATTTTSCSTSAASRRSPAPAPTPTCSTSAAMPHNLTFFLSRPDPASATSGRPARRHRHRRTSCTRLIVVEPAGHRADHRRRLADTSTSRARRRGRRRPRRRQGQRPLLLLRSAATRDQRARSTTTGDPWNSGDVIEIVGTTGRRHDHVDAASTLTLNAAATQVVDVRAPGCGRERPPDQGQGQQRRRPRSRSEHGADGAGPRRGRAGQRRRHRRRPRTLNGITGIARPGLNAPFGSASSSIVGGGGHDAVVIDDSGDACGGIGTMTAFTREPRRRHRPGRGRRRHAASAWL